MLILYKTLKDSQDTVIASERKSPRSPLPYQSQKRIPDQKVALALRDDFGGEGFESEGGADDSVDENGLDDKAAEAWFQALPKDSSGRVIDTKGKSVVRESWCLARLLASITSRQAGLLSSHRASPAPPEYRIGAAIDDLVEEVQEMEIGGEVVDLNGFFKRFKTEEDNE
ncbi:MAG: hypothetical protein Q9168_006600, partial [Polycauliona sp. 1 TL-2023]